MFSRFFVPQMFCHPVTRVFPCFFCFFVSLTTPPKKKKNHQNKKHTHIHLLTPFVPNKSHTTSKRNLSTKRHALPPCHKVTSRCQVVAKAKKTFTPMIWGIKAPQNFSTSEMDGMGLEHDTPPKFDIARENRESQKETHLPTIHFQGLC